MRGEKRKLIAIVMAIALVVLGANFVPNDVSAGTSYSGGVWTPSGTSTWRVNSAKGGEYSGGSSLGDTFTASVSAYSAWDWDFQMKSPVVSVEAGTQYTISVTMNTTYAYSNMRMQVLDGGDSGTATTVIAKGDIAHTANTDIVWTTTFTPTQNSICILFGSGWSNPGSVTLSNAWVKKTSEVGTTTQAPTAAPTTDAQGYYICNANDDWNDAENSAWSYNIATSGDEYTSTIRVGYKRNAGVSDTFYMNNEYYIGNEYAIQTRVHITGLTAGQQYKATLTVNSPGAKPGKAFIKAFDANDGAEGSYTDGDVLSGDDTVKGVNTLTVTYTPVGTDIYIQPILGWENPSALEYGLVSNNPTQTPTTTTTTTAAPTTTSDGWIDIPNGEDTLVPDSTNGPWTLFAWYNAYDGSGDWGKLAYKYTGTGTNLGDTQIKLVSSSGWLNDGQDAKLVGYLNGKMTVGRTYNVAISFTSNQATAENKNLAITMDGTKYTRSVTASTQTLNINNVEYTGTTQDIAFDFGEFTAGAIFSISSVTITDVTPTTVAPTTTEEAGYSAATLGDWTFAGAQNTGWQYFVNQDAANSKYKGGTSISDPLYIKYGTYVDSDYTCMARSPITAVTPGGSCTGSISITSGADIIGTDPDTGDPTAIVNASVYSYNASTGSYDWLQNSEEGAQLVYADTKTTFTFDYTSPATGNIVYVITTSYTPTTTIKFEATHSEEVPTTTTAAPTTTTADEWIDVPDATATTVGAWTLFANYAEWAQLQYKNNTASPSAVADTSIKVKNPTGWFNWNCTATLADYLTGKMTAGTSYKITINLNSSKATEAGHTLKVALDNVLYYFEVQQGSRQYVIDTFTYAGDNPNVVFDLSLMTAGTELTFSSIDIVANPDESTSAPETTTPAPVVDPDITLTGYQINTVSEGFRMVGQVEPQIEGSNVTEYGFVYGLAKIYRPATGELEPTGITDSDMTIDAKESGTPAYTYVKHYATTQAGIIDYKMGNSDTATYFARTMTFGKKNKAAYTSEYKVRVYAKLANGNTVYSEEVYNFSVKDIAEALYQGCLMNNIDNHNYLYNTILKKVDEDYVEVPYEYSHEIAVPGEKNS